MARADVHIFGSVSGYGTTAASAGVTESEKRELGSFQFGEAATADAIARLEHHAVMTGRPLASGRFAISRMLPAGVDDAGRPTIEVISLLLSASGYESCAGSMQMLASDVGLWRRARTEVSAGIEIPAANSAGDPEDLASLRAFDLWIAATRSGGVGVMSESEGPTVLAMVCTLHQRDRAQCRWGVGMLSISAPVDIASLASGTSTLGARAVIRAAKNGAWHCEETECAQVLATSGGKAFAALDELVEHVRPHLPELQDSRRYAHETGPSSSTREHRVTLAAIGSAVLSSLALALGLIVWTSSGRPPGGDVPPSAPSAPSDDVSDDGTASARDSGSAYGAVGPTPVAAVDPQKSVESAALEQTPEPSKEEPSAASTTTEDPATPPPDNIVVFVTRYRDEDGDGHGDPEEVREFEEGSVQPGWVESSDDNCPTNKTKFEPGILGCDFDKGCEGAFEELSAIKVELAKLHVGVALLLPNRTEAYFVEFTQKYRAFAVLGQKIFNLNAELSNTKVADSRFQCGQLRFMKATQEQSESTNGQSRVQTNVKFDAVWRDALEQIKDCQLSLLNQWDAFKAAAGGWDTAGSGAKGTRSAESWIREGERYWHRARDLDDEKDDPALKKVIKIINDDGWLNREISDVDKRIFNRTPDPNSPAS